MSVLGSVRVPRRVLRAFVKTREGYAVRSISGRARGGVASKGGYLRGAPGVLMKPPNSFRPSGMVTVRALAMLLRSFAP
jgi:hypothetical protein